jgi:phage terminase large subunit-like protein
MEESYADKIRKLNPEQKKMLEDMLKNNSISSEMLKTYPMLARPKQYLPYMMSDRIILVQAGRGAGKTWMAAGWVVQRIIDGTCKRGGIVGKTRNDVINVMIFGPGGLKDHAEMNGLSFKFDDKKAKMLIGDATIFFYTAEKPESGRGTNNDTLWLDEIGSWPNLSTKQGVAQGMLENLLIGLRIGDKQQCLITSTPARCKIFDELRKGKHGEYATIHMATMDNAAVLGDVYMKQLEANYGGSLLWRQEVLGEFLEAIEGSLWDYEDIRYGGVDDRTQFVKTVIGVDPAMTAHENSDMTGIVVVSKTSDGLLVVRDDQTIRAKADVWAKKVVELAEFYHASLVRVETNQGGDMVKDILEKYDCPCRIQGISQKMGKAERANIIKQLYDADLVFHETKFSELESEMFTWIPDIVKKSPDRIDALGLALWDFTKKKHMIVGSQMHKARYKDGEDNSYDIMGGKGKSWDKKFLMRSSRGTSRLLHGMSRAKKR